MSLAGDQRSRGVDAVAPIVAAAVEPLIGGELPFRVIAWDGSVAGRAGAPVLWLRTPAALGVMLSNPGELGAARAYIRGDIDVDGDLVEALDRVWSHASERRQRPFVAPSSAMHRLCMTAARLGAFRTVPRTAQNDETGADCAAVRRLYDTSADFYRLFLDPSMSYSCAYWPDSGRGASLAQAQRDQVDRVCHKLGLHTRRGMWLLDVGCGWGALSLHAAEQYGAQVVGLTRSLEQKRYIDRVSAERGLEDHVEIRVEDYRYTTEGPFDAAASIELGEHVRHDDYPAYAAALCRSVRRGGRVLVQQMSRRGHRPAAASFIESLIAPGMQMRPVGDTIALLEDSGLSMASVEAMREHYVRTADAWIDNLENRWDEAVELAGEETARVWRLYLAAGRLAFEQGRMGVDQILLTR